MRKGRTPHGGSGSSRSPWAREPSGASQPAERLESHPQGETQINIRGDARLLERFKRHCRDDRRTYIDMLRIMMDAYEARE